LEEAAGIMAAYKLVPQARYLVEWMADSKKGIHEVLCRLTSQLESVERKVDGNQVELGTVHEQVNLVMV
jgi:hypothetical protein